MPPTVSVQDFIEGACQEIDAKLGFIYQIPFQDPEQAASDPKMPLNQWYLIKSIAIKLASGRIILAVTAASQDTAIHAYGYSLVRDAEVSLMAVANADVRLTWPRVDSEGNPLNPGANPQDTDPLAYLPGGSNRDADSAVEFFEKNFMTPSYYMTPIENWAPGGG